MHRLTGAVKARMIAQVARFLTDTCTIEAQAKSTGAYGEVVDGWTLVAAGVPCRIIDAQRGSVADARIQSSRESIQDSYRLIVPNGTELAPNQRITVKGAEYNTASLTDMRTDGVFLQVIVVRQR